MGRGKNPFWVDKLTPIQLATFDLDEYRRLRAELTTDEWLDFMLRSMGYEPTVMERRLKLLFLSRLIPLCERNYNLVDFGPRGTGKSYAVQEFSPYASLLTGPTTVANLFGHMSGKQKGMVMIWDVVGFDEVADLQKMPKEDSALCKAPPQPALLVLGDLSIQGNIKAVRSLTEPLQVAMDNGGKRALLPIENKRQFLDVSPDVLEHVDPVFFGDMKQAAFKALALA